MRREPLILISLVALAWISVMTMVFFPFMAYRFWNKCQGDIENAAANVAIAGYQKRSTEALERAYPLKDALNGSELPHMQKTIPWANNQVKDAPGSASVTWDSQENVPGCIRIGNTLTIPKGALKCSSEYYLQPCNPVFEKGSGEPCL